MKTKLITFIIAIALSTPVVMAEDPQPSEMPILIDDGPIGIIPLTDEPRPTAWIENGFLTITFFEPEGMATMKIVAADGASTQVSFSTESPYTIYIGVVDQPMEITIRTALGNTYRGYIQ